MASEKAGMYLHLQQGTSRCTLRNALNTQEDNLVSRSLVDEAFDIRLRQQDILVGVYQGERHLGMRNAETAWPQ